MRRVIAILVAVLMIVTASAFLLNREDTVAYSNRDNWAFWADGTGDADVFFVCPTIDLGTDGNYNMDLKNSTSRESFVGASKMEMGIYDQNAVVYAPYYRQVTLPVYSLAEEEAEPYFEIAYRDVKAAFAHYLKKADSNRPLFLAGFSQGADMVVRLLKDYGNDPTVSKRLVAAYAIGWRLTEAETNEYPWLIPANGENDIGCIVAFNSEAEGITESLMVPAGTKTFAINPLNWKTDEELADASYNMGACFTDYSGEITQEIPNLTGAYLNSERGTLICVDIDPAGYPGILFPDGIYHLYDYLFFYRNLQHNVSVRLEAWQDHNR